MTETIAQEIQEIKISLDNADKDFIKALSMTEGDFRLVLQVTSNEVFTPTGIIKIPSGIITANDVGRALEAMSFFSNDSVYMHASASINFIVDGNLQTQHMPIGLLGQKLEVSTNFAKIPLGKLNRWHDWAKALGQHMVGWRIEEVHI